MAERCISRCLLAGVASLLGPKLGPKEAQERSVRHDEAYPHGLGSSPPPLHPSTRPHAPRTARRARHTTARLHGPREGRRWRGRAQSDRREARRDGPKRRRGPRTISAPRAWPVGTCLPVREGECRPAAACLSTRRPRSLSARSAAGSARATPLRDRDGAYRDQRTRRVAPQYSGARGRDEIEDGERPSHYRAKTSSQAAAAP